MPKSARPSDEIKRVPEKYLNLSPPTSTWDKNVEYVQIGRDRSAQFDDIYIISSLNHHISILRFRIAQQYTDFLTNLSISSSTPSPISPSDASHQAWSVLSVHRSRWYDLLKAEDRGEVVRGIWGIMGWLMRNTESDGKQDVQMEGI